MLVLLLVAAILSTDGSSWFGLNFAAKREVLKVQVSSGTKKLRAAASSILVRNTSMYILCTILISFVAEGF